MSVEQILSLVLALLDELGLTGWVQALIIISAVVTMWKHLGRA